MRLGRALPWLPIDIFPWHYHLWDHVRDGVRLRTPLCSIVPANENRHTCIYIIIYFYFFYIMKKME